MQSGREAICRMMRGGACRSCPLYDNPWRDTLRKWAKHGMPTDEKGNPVNPTEHFGFDIVVCGGWIDWQSKRGVHEVVEGTEEWRIVRNGAGTLLKWWKHKSGTPEHVDFHMTSREIREKEYRPLLVEFDPGRAGNVKTIAENLAKWRARGKWTCYGTQFIRENMRASMGDYTTFKPGSMRSTRWR